jgi:hypothetical protein
MNPRTTGSVAGVLGGLCWVVRWGADRAGDDPSWGEPVRWAGLVLLALGLAVAGAGLVSRSALWLRVIVAVAVPLLAWSVYSVVRGAEEDITLDGVLGAVACVGFGVALLRRRPPSRPQPDPVRHGSHAAR